MSLQVDCDDLMARREGLSGEQAYRALASALGLTDDKLKLIIADSPTATSGIEIAEAQGSVVTLFLV